MRVTRADKVSTTLDQRAIDATVKYWVDTVGTAIFDAHPDPSSTESCQQMAREVASLHAMLTPIAPYRDAVKQAAVAPMTNDVPWTWHQLAEAETCRAGLLTIYPDSPIPMHNHPGSSGAQLLLSGEASITQFNRMPQGETPLNYAIIQPATAHRLTTGQAAFFQPETANLHTLLAHNKPAVLLDIILPPYAPSARSWFFPLETAAWSNDCQIALVWNGARMPSTHKKLNPQNMIITGDIS